MLQDLVTTIVMFNRALYAQLAQQQFQPPKGYPMPPSNSPALRAAELGMKLTCGFEMVMAKGSSGGLPYHHTSCSTFRLHSATYVHTRWLASAACALLYHIKLQTHL